MHRVGIQEKQNRLLRLVPGAVAAVQRRERPSVGRQVIALERQLEARAIGAGLLNCAP